MFYAILKGVIYTKLEVFQIDAWAEPDGSWRYNNSISICEVEVNGQPTKRKILKALRNKGLLSPESIYQVDDYLTFEGTWVVQLRNGKPLFDLLELV